jgi:predicted dehydrogenase
MSRPFTVTRAQARELKRRSEKLRRQGGGIPHAVARREWLAQMERELRAMVRGYDGSARKARELLEALLAAEEEGVAAVAEIRHQLASKVARKRAA